MSQSGCGEDLEDIARSLSTISIGEMPKERPHARSSKEKAGTHNTDKFIKDANKIFNYNINQVDLNEENEDHRIISFLLSFEFWIRMGFYKIIALASDGFISRMKDRALVGECYACGNELNKSNPKQDTLEIHKKYCSFMQGTAGNKSMAPILKRKLNDFVKKSVKSMTRQTSGIRARPYEQRSTTNLDEQPSTSRQALAQSEDEEEDIDLYSAASETTSHSGGSFLSLNPTSEVLPPGVAARASVGNTTSRSPGSIASTIRSSTSHAPPQRGTNISLGVPMYNEMSDPVQRVLSFLNPNWKYVKRTRKFTAGDKDFAMAGFFYQGIHDLITCFYCGGELKDILASDVPHVIHIFNFPRCAYMQRKYGPAFISQIQDTNPNAAAVTAAPLPRETVKEVAIEPQVLPQPTHSSETMDARRQRLFTEAMATAPVRRIINDFKYDREEVETVIKEKIRKDNWYFETTEALILALSKDVDDLSDTEDEPPHPPIQRTRPPLTTMDRFNYYQYIAPVHGSTVSYPGYNVPQIVRRTRASTARPLQSATILDRRAVSEPSSVATFPEYGRNINSSSRTVIPTYQDLDVKSVEEDILRSVRWQWDDKSRAHSHLGIDGHLLVSAQAK